MIYLKTVGQYLFIFFIILCINFALPRIAPGDPAIYLVGEDIQNMSDEERNNVLAEFKLDRPVLTQFKHYIAGIFNGDLGTSLIYGLPVWSVVLSRLPWTLLVMGVSLVITVLIGMVLGIVAAWKRGGNKDVGSLITVMFMGSLPPFWIAMLLITLFSATLEWFPSFGAYAISAEPGSFEFFVSVLDRLFLPVLTLTLVNAGRMFLTTRSSMIMAMEEDYVMMAHAKGLKEIAVVFKHAFRNALLPVYTYTVLEMGQLIAGAAIIETVFSYPGIGNTIYESVIARDYSLLQGCFLIISISILLANFIADLGYPLLDPRVRRSVTVG